MHTYTKVSIKKYWVLLFHVIKVTFKRGKKKKEYIQRCVLPSALSLNSPLQALKPREHHWDPSPSPPPPKQPLFLFLCLSSPYWFFFFFFKFYHMCLVLQAYELYIKTIILDVLLCNFLFPLNILFLGLIHAAARNPVSLIFLSWCYSIVWIFHS